MDRSARMITLFQTLEKFQEQTKFNQDELLQIKFAVSKIHQYISSQDKTYREMLLKNSANLDLFLCILDNCSDPVIRTSILNTLLEILARSGAKSAATLVSHGTTHILFRVLVSQQRHHEATEESQQLIHQVLAKLGPKDRKFGVKARLSQAVSVTLDLTKTHFSNLRILQPSLTVLKLYATNAVNASYLGKNGLITLLFKIFSNTSRRNTPVIKQCLDILVLLVKRKSNAARVVNQGGVPVLVKQYFEWHRLDNKNNHVPIRKGILNVLKHVTNLKVGRKAFLEADGISTLYVCCQETAEAPELDSVNVLASIIMRKSFPRNRLPLLSCNSPLPFDQPGSDPIGQIRCQPRKSSAEEMESDVMRCHSVGSFTQLDEKTSSGESEDELSSEEHLLQDKANSEDEEEIYNSQASTQRTWEDLYQYRHVFPEIMEFEIPPEESDNADEQMSSCEGPASTRGAWNPFRRRSGPSRHSSLTKSSSADQLIGSQSSLAALTQGGATKLSSSSTCEIRSSQGFTDLLEVQAITSRKPLISRSPQQKETDLCKNSCAPRTFKSAPLLPQDLNFPESLQNSPPSHSISVTDFQGGHVSPSLYSNIAKKTVSVGRFNKVAYPDIYGSLPPPDDEPLHEKKFGLQRSKIFEDIERYIDPEAILDHVVYDLDNAILAHPDRYTHEYSDLTNNDRENVGKRLAVDHLCFNAQFECGNLRKVIQVRENEYDLILNPDVNTNHHHQWFYFEVSNVKAKVKYRFNIVNCEKVNSQFNFGMRPVLFSVKEAMEGNPYWRRDGSEIAYYKNHFSRSSKVTGGVKGKSYFTTTFTLTFKHDNDICYVAYHYPYSYTTMKAHLYRWEKTYNSEEIFFRNQKLCETMSGNEVPVLTITSYPKGSDRQSIIEFKNKPYIFLSSRVHPGESNSSYVMHGTLDFLLSDAPAAATLRDIYIFKVVPMLNPDGVINGNHRCSLAGEDLNRCWMCPCPRAQPTIFHCKGLLQFMHMLNRSPLVFCDYHGHSRKKNVFLYGCNPKDSWIPDDTDNPASTGNRAEDTGFRVLPEILHQTAAAFSLENCSFVVEKSKETTARVVVWRQIRVVRSYTMESSYCGCDQGPYRGLHISTRELHEMGKKFCEALLKIRSRLQQRVDLAPAFLNAESSSESSIGSECSDETLSVSWLARTRSAGAGTPVEDEDKMREGSNSENDSEAEINLSREQDGEED